jgi:selenocysteine lyase/cysteine desulfurase
MLQSQRALFSLDREMAYFNGAYMSPQLKSVEAAGIKGLKQKIKPDALICAGYKWLMGPYSIGLAYFGAYFDAGTPIEHNWINRLHSEDFRSLVNYQNGYKPLASKYAVGEQSSFILVPMMKAAIDQLLEWQPENIQAYCKQLLEEPIQYLTEKGIQIEPPEQRAHHMIGLRLPARLEHEKLKRALHDNNVHLSFRGDAIRLSCHLYNDEQDVERLLRAFDQVI